MTASRPQLGRPRLRALGQPRRRQQGAPARSRRPGRPAGPGRRDRAGRRLARRRCGSACCAARQPRRRGRRRPAPAGPARSAALRPARSPSARRSRWRMPRASRWPATSPAASTSTPRDGEALAAALAEVWGSAERAGGTFRRDVLLLQMVDARHAGVAFSEQEHEDDLVNVVAGTADRLVSGAVAGDVLLLPKLRPWERPPGTASLLPDAAVRAAPPAPPPRHPPRLRSRATGTSSGPTTASAAG